MTTLPNTCRLGQARQSLLEIGKRQFGVDDGFDARCHFGESIGDIANACAERADDAVLLLKQLHEIEGRRRPGSRAAGHKAASAFHRQQRAVECVRADMFEHDVDALLRGDLAHRAFETVGLVIDHVVGAQRLGPLGLGIVADSGDDGAIERLRHPDRRGADAGAAGVDEDPFAALKLGIVEQHVLDR